MKLVLGWTSADAAIADLKQHTDIPHTQDIIDMIEYERCSNCACWVELRLLEQDAGFRIDILHDDDCDTPEDKMVHLPPKRKKN